MATYYQAVREGIGAGIGTALAVLAMGCAVMARPVKGEPILLRHLVVVNGEADCFKPLIVWDASIQRRVAYCDGKVK